MKVTKKDLIGDIEGFPLEVVERMCEEQVRQGNKFDVSVFQKSKWEDLVGGGFEWSDSEEGHRYWSDILDFLPLKKFYRADSLKVKVKKIVPEAKIPKYAREGDAGLDLTVTSVEDVELNHTKYGFGLAFEIPVGYVGLIFPRSSCYKKGQLMSNAVGVIDSSYRGEVSAVMIDTSVERYEIGERAAQLIIMPYPKIELEEVEELSETERGQGGYGSTGK